MQKHDEWYMVFDVESDGPFPGLNSMLSLGAVAIGWDNVQQQWAVSNIFYRKLVPLLEARQDLDTMAFWKKNPEAYIEATTDAAAPATVMAEFVSWCATANLFWNSGPIFCTSGPKRKMVPVCAPVGFDFPFARYYLLKFLGSDLPLKHSAADLRTLASEKLGLAWADTGKSSYPKAWFKDAYPHTHRADEDALEQAFIWTRIIDHT